MANLFYKKPNGAMRPEQIQALTQGYTAQQPVPVDSLVESAPETEADQMLINSEKTTEPISVDRFAELQAAAQQKVQPYLDAESASVDDLSDAANNYAAHPTETDISPLAALVDTLTGSQLAKTITKPKTSPLDKLENVAALKGLVSKGRGSLTENQIKSLLGIGGKQIESEKRQSRADTGITVKFGQGIIADTKGVNKEYSEAAGKLDKLESVYKTGDIKQITSILGDMAKYVGGNLGATSDADAARQLYDTINKKIVGWETKFGIDGKLPDSEINSYLKLIQTSRGVVGDIYKNKYSNVKDQYTSQAEAIGKPGLMAPDSAWDKYFNKQSTNIGKGFQPMENRQVPAKQGQKPQSKMSFEQWKAMKK